LQIAGIISRALYDTAFERRECLRCAWYFDFYARSRRHSTHSSRALTAPFTAHQKPNDRIENVLKCRFETPILYWGFKNQCQSIIQIKLKQLNFNPLVIKIILDIYGRHEINKK
jgi:hypothetical protein